MPADDQKVIFNESENHFAELPVSFLFVVGRYKPRDNYKFSKESGWLAVGLLKIQIYLRKVQGKYLFFQRDSDENVNRSIEIT